ncbi:MAG: hypothetical protein RLZZ592_1689 [Pseudomonadota bacterium]|jgi:hypothetical protein
MNQPDTPFDRTQIASRIRDLLRRETGQEVDLPQMLLRTDYARAVLSLCRASGHPELVRLADQFPGPRETIGGLSAALPGRHR